MYGYASTWPQAKVAISVIYPTDVPYTTRYVHVIDSLDVIKPLSLLVSIMYLYQ